MSDSSDTVDVVVVGGGPAGLAAATELRRLGAGRVVLVDREPQAGGIPRHCGHPPFGMREFHRILRGPDYAARLAARAAEAGVEIRTRVTVTELRPGGRLACTTPDGLAEIAGRAVLLATGVRETSRAGRLIGGEKPGGVLPTGALQGLVYLEGRRPFRRPVIVGSELVAFSALLTCRHAGIRPVAMVEQGSRPTARSFAVLLARAMGVPVLTGTRVHSVAGRDRVERVVVEDAAGRHELDADGLVVSGGFRPEATLLRASHLAVDPATGGPVIDTYGRLSDPAYFAAGNLLRPVETAGWCWAEGRRAAQAIAAALAGALPDPGTGIRLVSDGDPIKFAVPQVIMPGAPGGGGSDRLQVRLSRPARGRLELHRDGRVVAARDVDSRPERRILLRLPPLPPGEGVLRLAFEEG
jgi:NADPH-dependent 2,4-dienoyl-CoA reductase/sulfur reductase-like enzyme